MPRRLILIGALLVLTAAIGGIVRDPQLARCVLLSPYALDQIESGVYVERSYSSEQRESLRQTVHAARARVESFLGDRVGHPIIIAGGAETYRKYGSSGADYSLTKVTPFRDYIVLGRSGANIDCVSHEMVHVELRRRIGFRRYMQEALPTWFDEGAAMYVDYRPPFDERAYESLKANGTVTALPEIATRNAFYQQHRNAYTVAKHEFREWYEGAGQEAFITLLRAVEGGADFIAVYGAGTKH
jgi:hypothetical protein